MTKDYYNSLMNPGFLSSEKSKKDEIESIKKENIELKAKLTLLETLYNDLQKRINMKETQIEDINELTHEDGNPLVGCRMHVGPVGSKHGWFFTVSKEPTSTKEYVEILEELIRMAKAPDVEDTEVLGDRSL